MRISAPIRWLFLFFICPYIFSGNANAQSEPTTIQVTLQSCIATGLEKHPNIAINKNKVAQAHQAKKEALSAYLPQVNAEAGLDNNIKLPVQIIPEGTFGPGTPEQEVAFGTKYSSSITGQINQTIYNQSYIQGIKAAKPNTELAELNRQKSEEEIIYDIATSYFQILVAKKQLELLESNKDRLERILNVTQLQSDVGVAKKIDVKQVQVNLNNVLSQITLIERNVRLAENTLKFNMGIPQEYQLEIQDESRWLDTKPAPKIHTEFHLESNYDYQMLGKQIELLDIQTKVIRDQAIPSLSAFAVYGFTGFGNDVSTSFDPLRDFSMIGLKLNWSIFTGLRRDAQYKSAKIDVENAKINRSLMEQALSLQFENADAQIERAQKTIHTNESNMELAAEVYDNTTLQYREGVASLSDLLNAELAYRESQTNYITSLLDYYIADLDVEKTNGTLKTYFEKLN